MRTDPRHGRITASTQYSDDDDPDHTTDYVSRSTSVFDKAGRLVSWTLEEGYDADGVWDTRDTVTSTVT